jgi:hypothetical protein
MNNLFVPASPSATGKSAAFGMTPDRTFLEFRDVKAGCKKVLDSPTIWI